MKKLSLSFLTIMICGLCFAQVPQALNYQAVARTSGGQIIPSQNIAVRFTILDGSTTGSVVYSETQNITTNNFGLFTLAIGKGIVQTGTFASVAWDTGNKYLKVEIAPQGGNNYLLQGTTQLLSVPYALYAEKTKLVAGNNSILVAGNVITGNYQAANNTILVTGNTIAGNYQPANNTILVAGNTIAGNYQAGQGVSITGNTISGNYLAGTGISITGSTISATGSSLWITDALGIHNQSGAVGIGTNSTGAAMLSLQQVATGGSSGALDIFSSDTYHTATRWRNTTANAEWNMLIGGSTNAYQRAGSMALWNGRNLDWLWHGDINTTFLGVGSTGAVMPQPKSRLHVFNGDVNIDQIGSGIILKSPNGNCWRVTIDNAGNLVRTAITCP